MRDVNSSLFSRYTCLYYNVYTCRGQKALDLEHFDQLTYQVHERIPLLST